MNETPDALISSLQHFSVGDGPGIRSTIFFQGCPLHCAWCHNPETISRTPQLLFYAARCRGCGRCRAVCPFGAREDRSRCRACFACVKACPHGALQASGRRYEMDEIMKFILEDVEFYESSGGGVTLSGGEPLLQTDFCAALAAQCRQQSIPVLVDTALQVSAREIDKMLPWTDSWYADLKAPDEETYRRMTGGSLKLTLDNLTLLTAAGADVTARIPLIPGVTFSEQACRRMAGLLKQAGVCKAAVLPFHRMGSAKYRALEKTYDYADTEPLSRADAMRAAAWLCEEGLKAEADG